MFRIWCEVWGGAAQSQDGRQLVFHDKLSLQREAMIS